MSYDSIGRGVIGLIGVITTLAAIGFTVATPFLWWLAFSIWRTK